VPKKVKLVFGYQGYQGRQLLRIRWDVGLGNFWLVYLFTVSNLGLFLAIVGHPRSCWAQCSFTMHVWTLRKFLNFKPCILCYVFLTFVFIFVSFLLPLCVMLGLEVCVNWTMNFYKDTCKCVFCLGAPACLNVFLFFQANKWLIDWLIMLLASLLTCIGDLCRPISKVLVYIADGFFCRFSVKYLCFFTYITQLASVVG